MKLYFSKTLFFILLALFAVNYSAKTFETQPHPNKNVNLKKDLQLMMKWFEGRFDNYQQTYAQKQNKTEFPHEHIHSIFHRVNLPKIGKKRVFLSSNTWMETRRKFIGRDFIPLPQIIKKRRSS